METTTRIAAVAAALLTLTSVEARAQLIELPATAGASADLTAHQIRVVQLALRDQECYRGTINGRWTAATRTALQCARERTSATEPDSLARALALWSADEMTTRTMAGDVAPAAPATSPAAPPAMSAPTPTTPPAAPTRDSTMIRDSSAAMPMPMRDSSMAMPMRDSSMAMPVRDSSTRDTTTSNRPMMRDTTTTMPMTPTEPLSPMSRTGATTQDSLLAADIRTGSMQDDVIPGSGAAMLVAQVDSVIAAAEGGLTSMPPAQAATLLANIATQLDAANQPALASIATDLRSLRTQLTATPFDAATVGRSLTAVSDKVETVAASQTGDVQAKLMRLATLLETSGRQLAPQD